jgi:hypothetical protein
VRARLRLVQSRQSYRKTLEDIGKTTVKSERRPYVVRHAQLYMTRLSPSEVPCKLHDPLKRSRRWLPGSRLGGTAAPAYGRQL